MLAEKDAGLILKIENKIRRLKIETFEKNRKNGWHKRLEHLRLCHRIIRSNNEHW